MTSNHVIRVTDLTPETPKPLQGKTATIASLSRRERNPQGGEKRRKMVATVLGTAGGVGSVLAVKSAATAAALWAGSPALIVAGVGLAAVMATSGTLGYFRHRSALKATGNPVPAFSTKDLFKSMFTSKAALVAGGMTAVAAALPGALMLVVGSSVAALGAGVHEYKSRRAEMRAQGIDVGRPSVRDAFRTIFKSKSAGTAFLLSAGIGSVLSLLSGTSLSAPVGDVSHPVSGDVAGAFHDASVTGDTAELAAAPAVAPEPPMPMPEMVERPVVEAAPVAAAASVEATPLEAAPAEAAPEPAPVKSAPVEKVEVAAPKPVVAPAAAPVAPAVVAPAVSAPLPSEVIFDNTGPDGVRQILYGSGIIETIYPAEGSSVEPAAPVAATPAPAAPVSTPAAAHTTTAQAPTASAPAAPVHAAPQPAAPVTSDTTDANGVRTILHASGIRETITPVYADAVQATAPVHTGPAVNLPADLKMPSAGECLISETDTEIKVDCKIDTKATIQPGSGVDFRTAANPQTVFHAGVSADSDAINAGEFLEDHAVPAAQSAYEKGFFKPQMK